MRVTILVDNLAARGLEARNSSTAPAWGTGRISSWPNKACSRCFRASGFVL